MNDNRLILLFCGIAFAWIASACGNPPTAAEETQTAAVAGATPQITIPVPAPSPISVPGGLAEATPAPITPAPPGTAGARADCPSGWVTYRGAGGRLSLCGPPDIDATADVNARLEPGLIIGTRSHDGVPEAGSPRFVVGARITSSPALALNLALADVCHSGGHAEGTVVQRDIGPFAFSGCRWMEEPNSAEGPLTSMLVVAQLPGGAYLDLEVNWRSQDAGAGELADTIAGTLFVAP